MRITNNDRLVLGAIVTGADTSLAIAAAIGIEQKHVSVILNRLRDEKHLIVSQAVAARGPGEPFLRWSIAQPNRLAQ